MSSHINGEQIASVSEGVKIEGPGAFIGHQLGLAITAASSLTLPGNGETMAMVQADGNDVRMTLDGSAPTATNGWLIKNGTSLTLTAIDAAAAKFIQVAATAKLNAWFAL